MLTIFSGKAGGKQRCQQSTYSTEGLAAYQQALFVRPKTVPTQTREAYVARGTLTTPAIPAKREERQTKRKRDDPTVKAAKAAKRTTTKQGAAARTALTKMAVNALV